MATSPLPSCSHWVFFLLTASYFSTFFHGNKVEATQRVLLYPESQQVTSIVSKQYRTAYHFEPLKNWINDPNGPLYYKGIYHLFYQYNPYSVRPGNKTWGHSISTDLINWVSLELALDRTEPSYDIAGCWSGSVTLVRADQPGILYTGVAFPDKHQTQNLAEPKNRSDPFLREWIKSDYNPIIKPVEPDLDSHNFRDPTTAWLGSDGLWRVAIGAELNGSGTALLYKSEDFVHWVRASAPLHSSNATKVWECPDFFPALPPATIPSGGKHVLKMSLTETRRDYYMIGVYDKDKDVFVPDDVPEDPRLWPRIDHGNYYASKSFFDPKKKRRILLGWSNESDSLSNDLAKGWAGIHVIPRAIWLADNGKQLMQWPIEEVESLRRDVVHLKDEDIKRGGLLEIKGIDASQADIEVDFELASLESAEPFDLSWLLDPQKLCEEVDASVQGGIGPFGLLVLASDGLEEHTAVYFRVYKSQESYMILMCSDQRRSSTRDGLYKPAFGGFFDMDFSNEGKLSLRTLIDHSVIESFGGVGKACITARVYPAALAEGAIIHLYAFNNGTAPVKISDLKAWSMRKAQIS